MTSFLLFAVAGVSSPTLPRPSPNLSQRISASPAARTSVGRIPAKTRPAPATFGDEATRRRRWGRRPRDSRPRKEVGRQRRPKRQPSQPKEPLQQERQKRLKSSKLPEMAGKKNPGRKRVTLAAKEKRSPRARAQTLALFLPAQEKRRRPSLRAGRGRRASSNRWKKVSRFRKSVAARAVKKLRGRNREVPIRAKAESSAEVRLQPNLSPLRSRRWHLLRLPEMQRRPLQCQQQL